MEENEQNNTRNTLDDNNHAYHGHIKFGLKLSFQRYERFCFVLFRCYLLLLYIFVFATNEQTNEQTEKNGLNKEDRQ